MCQELLLLRGNFVGTISFPLLVQELAGSKSECDKGSSGSLAWSFNIKNPHIPLVSTIANYRIFFLISFCMPVGNAICFHANAKCCLYNSGYGKCQYCKNQNFCEHNA